MLSSSNGSGNRRNALIVTSILVLVGVLAVLRNHSSPISSVGGKLALVSKGEMPSVDEGFEPAAKSIWDLEDEDAFRSELTWKGESKFVERLVSEWKLAKKSSDVVSKDNYYLVQKNRCSPPLGGGGGAHFSYFHTGLAYPGVTHFCGRSGALLDRIDITFSNGFRLARGGGGGNAFCVRLNSHCVTRINIRTGALVDGLQIITNYGWHSRWYGGHGGNYHQVAGVQGTCLRGVMGRAGALVDNLQFCFA